MVLISKSYDELVTIVSDIREFCGLCQNCSSIICCSAESQYSVQALGIHADFGLGRPVFQDIEDALQGYEIGILGEGVEQHLSKRNVYRVLFLRIFFVLFSLRFECHSLSLSLSLSRPVYLQ